MTNRQENKRSMYRAVITFLLENKAVYESYAPFFESAKRFVAVNDSINEQAEVQTMQIVGVAEDKQRVRGGLEVLLVSICSKVMVYARLTNNHTLRAKVSYSASSLGRKRDTLLLDTANNVHTVVGLHLGNLGAYQVTSADLELLSDKMSEFNAILSEPRHQIVLRKGATQQINLLFKEADAIIKKELDLLVVNFSASHPEFERAYNNVRMIVDLGGRHKMDKVGDVAE